QIIRADGGDIIEKDLDRDAIYSADEIFMTGTAAEVKSVTQVDDVIIGDGKIGQTTQTLQKSFMDVAMGRDERFIHWLRYL
ncbi:MAG TPA: branched chain amino acid aminotransferase, partial [Candidatus Nitrosotenuis sp.]